MGRARRVELGPTGFRIDGAERPLVAGQMEPFRHNALYWRRSLEAIKGAGIDLVSIFICWEFQELEPGKFDFTGETNPSRDLVGFLDLCEELDLLVLARPGPLIDAEWETRGPPPDVMKLERLHPRFLERAQEYIQAVCEVLAPRQITEGGPIALLGVDNEILYPYTTPESQHFVDGDVYVPSDEEYTSSQLREWLSGRYESIASLNDVLGTNFGDWDEVGIPRYREHPPGYSLETFRFINHQILRFAERCQAMYREAGMEIPTYTNMKQLLAYIDWVPVAQELNSVGINLHSPRDMPGDQALVANWWYRLHRARFPFMWAAEFQCGWIGLDDEYGFISDDHSEYMPMAAQAAGLRGLNFYMFVERDDWSYSPVNLMGKIRPSRYERFRRVVASYGGIRQQDRHLSDVGLIWSLEDHQTLYLETDRDWTTLTDHWLQAGERKEPPTWWSVFRFMAEHDVDFRLWIPGVTEGDPPRILVHAGLPTTTTEHMTNLGKDFDRIERLVAVTPLPRSDPAGRPEGSIAEISDRIESSDRLARATPENLVTTLTRLGTRAFARSGAQGVWTYVYRDEGEGIVLGVWNAGSDPYGGPVWMNPSMFAGSPEWRVSEPRVKEDRALSRDEVEVFPVELSPHSARVWRFTRP